MHVSRFILAALIASSAVAADAAGTASPASFDALMKKAGATMQLLQKSVGSDSYAEVKTQLPVLREALRSSQDLWTSNNVTDAVTLTRDALARVDALAGAVAAQPVDGAAVRSAARDLSTACSSCHRTYRTTDEDNHFIIRPDALRK
jgi:cytochrome c556